MGGPVSIQENFSSMSSAPCALPQQGEEQETGDKGLCTGDKDKGQGSRDRGCGNREGNTTCAWWHLFEKGT